MTLGLERALANDKSKRPLTKKTSHRNGLNRGRVALREF